MQHALRPELVWRIWQRRKWLAVLVFAVPCAVLAGVLPVLPNLYRSSAVVLVERPEIPDLPGLVFPAASGPDPLVNIPTDLSGPPGSTVTVPVNIDNAAGLQSVDLKLSYDTALLDVGEVLKGSATSAGSSWIAPLTRTRVKPC